MLLLDLLLGLLAVDSPGGDDGAISLLNDVEDLFLSVSSGLLSRGGAVLLALDLDFDLLARLFVLLSGDHGAIGVGLGGHASLSAILVLLDHDRLAVSVTLGGSLLSLALLVNLDDGRGAVLVDLGDRDALVLTISALSGLNGAVIEGGGSRLDDFYLARAITLVSSGDDFDSVAIGSGFDRFSGAVGLDNLNCDSAIYILSGVSNSLIAVLVSSDLLD